MTVKDCIVKAAELLGLKELALALSGGTAKEDEKAEFLSMARDVIAEICSDYYPLKITESLTADEGGVVKLSAFSRPVIDIFRAAKNGVCLPFMIKFDRLEVKRSGEIEVEYSFMPEMESVESVLPFSSRIDARVIGFGIAAEYCILNRPLEAEMFDERYKNALKKAILHKAARKIPQRRWL